MSRSGNFESWTYDFFCENQVWSIFFVGFNLFLFCFLVSDGRFWFSIFILIWNIFIIPGILDYLIKKEKKKGGGVV